MYNLHKNNIEILFYLSKNNLQKIKKTLAKKKEIVYNHYCCDIKSVDTGGCH